MNLIDASFPYPVLSPNTDDVSFTTCSYTPEVVYDKVNHKYDIGVSIDIDDPYIIDLIEQGYAVFAMEVKCDGTRLVRRESGSDPNLAMPIEEGNLKGNVEINFTVTAIKHIESYCNPRAHEDFGGQSFTIEPGEVLAYLGTEVLATDIKYSKLGAASSFIEVRPLEIDSPYMQFDLESPIIGICLPKEMYKDYQTIWRNPNFPEVFHASVVHNALLFALTQFANYKDKDLTWVKTIQYYMDNVDALKSAFGEDAKNAEAEDRTIFEDPTVCQKVAQIILDNPTKRLLVNLKKQQETMSNDNQEEA